MFDQKEIWNRAWIKTKEKEIIKRAKKEQTSTRFKLLCSIIEEEFGTIKNLHVVEIGSGAGMNSLALSIRGAKPTLVDYSEAALKKASALFEHFNIRATFINQDILSIDEGMRGRFDVCISFGLAEHYLGKDRERIIEAHLNLIRSGGLIVVSVPNSFCPMYRMYMAILKMTGKWKLGLEIPYTRDELKRIAQRVGAKNIRVYGTNFCVSIDDHLLRFFRYPIQKVGLPIPSTWFPDFRVPFLDNYFGYALLLVAKK